ncbi:MAG TPA: hypothetical protein VNK44_02020 [Candidatus Nitrosotenuis sp.]|nr:hypothetical protein [Candidatus Nitrosotenuis sp.]
MKKRICIVTVLVLLAGLQLAEAQEMQVSTSKNIYHYGDYLQITISVAAVTEDNAIMHIIDSAGMKSSSIPIKIQDTTTTITSPNPFDALIFKEGKYKIEVQYGGSSASTEFELVDAGNIVMPFGSNIIVPQWAGGTISDYGFLKFLADKGVINLPQGKFLTQQAMIPSWFKSSAKWWSEHKITDEELLNGINYLLGRNVIIL